MQAAEAESTTGQGCFDQVVAAMAGEAHLAHQTFGHGGFEQLGTGPPQGPGQVGLGVEAVDRQVVEPRQAKASQAGPQLLQSLGQPHPFAGTWQQLASEHQLGATDRIALRQASENFAEEGFCRAVGRSRLEVVDAGLQGRIHHPLQNPAALQGSHRAQGEQGD